MRNEELKKAYPNPPAEFHNAVLSALYKLDSKSPARYKKRRIARLAIAFVVIIALGSFTAAASTTRFFGLFSEPVGKYGLHVGVTEEASTLESEHQKSVKMNFGYMTDGFTELPNTANDLLKFQNPDDDTAGSFSFSVIPAKEFENTERYIIDYEETTINGHKLIVSTRQVSEYGNLDYLANLYFEDWGYVVSGGAYNGASKDELLKIMQNLTLEEDTDYVPETLPDDITPSDLAIKRREYARTVDTDFTMHKVGESFKWGRKENSDDFTVKVTSVKEQNNTDGIPEEYFGWTTDYSLTYPDYFDESGNLITPYTRHNITDSDGINTQRKEWYTEDDRHFFVVTVEITQDIDSPYADFDMFADFSPIILIRDGSGSYHYNGAEDEYGITQNILYGNIAAVCSNPGDEINLLHMSKGETRTLTFGIVVDDDILDNAYLRFSSDGRNIIDDDAETIAQIFSNDCVKIKE